MRTAVAVAVLVVSLGVAILARVAGSAGTVTTAVPGGDRALAGSPSASGAVEAAASAASTAAAASGVGPTATASPAGLSTVPGGLLVVDVVGEVRHAGLVRLPAGSRIGDAVSAAGGAGPHADLARVNLARPLADGEQVVVPRLGDPVPVADDGDASGATPSAITTAAVVDLNAASVTELDALPGIGPVLAGRIIAWRAEHGRFSTVEELGEVSGIGDALLSRLRPLVRV